MATSFSEIILNYAMTEISDVRLTEEMEQNPAAFIRKMVIYLKDAIPLFKHPAEAQSWLTISEDADFASGGYGDLWQQTPPFTITGEAGYSVVSGALLTYDHFNNPVYTPFSGFEYDAETGDITVTQQIPQNAILEMSYYNDGSFANELPGEIKRILGLCVQYVWTSRFINDYVMQSPKVHDKDFNISSEANYNRAETDRLNRLRDHLYDEQRALEQNLRYGQTVKSEALKLTMPEA